MAQKIVSYSGKVLSDGGSSHKESGSEKEQKIVSYSGRVLQPDTGGGKTYKTAESLLQDTNQFLRMASRDTKEDRYFNAADYFEERKKQAEALKIRASEVSRLLESDMGYDPESYNELADYLSNFNTMVDDVLKAYQPSLQSREGMRAYEDEMLAAMERRQKNQDLFRSKVDYEESPSRNLPDYSYRSVNDNWTQEQRYTLGQLQLQNPEEAQKYATEVNKYYSEMNKYAEQDRRKQEMEALDLDAAKQEIDQLKADLENFYATHDYTGDAEYRQKQKELTQKETLYNQAVRNREAEAFKSVKNNADFAEKSNYVSTEAQNFRDRMFSEYGMGYNDLTYEYINDPERVQGYNDEFTRRMLESNYELMQNDEIAIYNYLHATEGKDKAQAYLDSIQDELGRRRAEQIYSNLEGKTAKEIAFGVNAGLNQFMTSTKNLLSNADYLPVSATQQASQMVRQDLQDRAAIKKAETGVGSIAPLLYDLTTTTANMIPSMAAGALANAALPGSGAFAGLAGKAVGSTLMGMSAAGGAYQEAINSGYNKEQARTYSTMVGLAETGMESMLGLVGGGMPDAIKMKAIDAVDGALAKFAVEQGFDMLSEGTEEALQEVISPWLEEVFLNADKRDVDLKEVAYAGLLGALSTLPFAAVEGGKTAATSWASRRSAPATAAAPAVEAKTFQAPVKMPTVSTEGKAMQISSQKALDVKDFASMSDNGATIMTNDGEVVNYDDVSFADQQQANQFYAVRSLPGLDTEAANDLLTAIQNADAGQDTDSVVGIRDAYRIGYFNQDVKGLKTGDASVLSPELRQAVYDIGVRQNQAEEAVKASATAVTTKPSEGYKKVTLEGNIKLDTNQKAQVDFIDKFSSKVSKASVHVFESYVKNGKRYYKDSNGKEVLAPNGKYVNGEIWVDLKAGDKGEGLILNTFAHELYHHIESQNKAGANKLASWVSKNMGIKNVDAAVEAQIRKARAAGFGEKYFEKKGMTAEQARNEVYARAMSDFVADSLETMFTRGDPAEAIAQLYKEDRTLFDQIKEFIDKFISQVKQFYSDKTISAEGAAVAQLENFQELQRMFMEAAKGAGENYQAALDALSPGVEGEIFTEDGEPVAMATEDGSVMLSTRTYEEEGRKAFRLYLDKCVTSKRLTEQQAQEMRDGIEEMYQICKDFKDKYAPFSAWSDAEVIRDTHGRPVFSVVTPNGDYKMNLDFSLVCKKRRTLDAVFNEMSKRGIIDDFELGQKSVVKINEIIRKHGMETACALCFVDAKRFRQAAMADSFTKLYNDLVNSLVPEGKQGSIDHFNFSGYDTIRKVNDGIDTWKSSELDFSHLDKVMKEYGSGTVEYKAAKYIKTHPEGRKLMLRGDFMSSQGFDAVKTQNKDILKLYNSKKGTGGPKAAFGDVQYLNEIIKKARTWTPAKAYEVGGVRIQSFSDYVPRMVFDYTQMIYDLAATQLPAHAYTKEALFVKQFGLTGVKINMSLIPAIAEGGIAPGLDADGNYVWAGESFDYETAKQIQNADGYSENCGTICVGVSKQHIEKLLSDPNIRMVIPYHKSGLNPIVAHMNKIAEFTDYTSLKTNPGGCQSTIDKNGSKVTKDFNFNEELKKIGDPKATVRKYLDWCSENEYTPKFAEFKDHENYYKLIEDFTLYDKDGNYVPQREVRAVFPKATDAFGSMKDLIQEGLQEDAVVEGKRDKNLSAIVDEIQNTLPKTEAEIEETQVEQADRDLEAFSLRGVNQDDIEVYETSDEVKKLTKKERQQRFLDIMNNEYRGRTAKFIRNGHAYYATFDEKDINKNIYGDKRSDKKGYRAKINTGVDGDIFELVENSKYDGSKPEKGKKITAHNGVGYWDYFIKTVQIDGVVYDMLANVRKKADGAFVYSIQLNENKKIKASPPRGLLLKASNGVTNASGDMVSQPDSTVNTEMYSLRNEKPLTNRQILEQLDIEKRKSWERGHLERYQERRELLSQEKPKLEAVNARIKELSADPKQNKAALNQLKAEARALKRSVDSLNRKIREQEQSEMFKRIVTEERAKLQKEESKKALKSYKDEQRELVKEMQLEQRVIREELTGKKSDITIMEREFVRIAKQYEKLDERTGKKSAKDAKVIAELKAALKEEAKSHSEDSKIWEREFNRLLKDYETSGRQIERLEATILRQRATAKARVESRRNTEMRHKIQKKVNELDQLLRHGSKHRNVPEFLQDSVAAVLQAINMEVRDGDQRRKSFEATLARYDRQIAMTSDPAKVADLIEKRNAYEAKGDQFANRMENLQAAYKQIREENTGIELDEGIAGHLDSLFETVGNTPLGQMNAAQLDAVNDILNVTMATVRNANQLLAEERSAGVLENSKDAVREIKNAGETKKTKTRLRKNLEQFGWNNLKPTYVFDVIGSKTLTNLYESLRSGEDTLAVDLDQAKTFFRDQWKKNGGKEWDMDKKYKFESTSGKSFELDLNQIMSLYAMSKDKDARSHLRVGGFAFDSDYQTQKKVGPFKMKVESADASAYNLSDEILGEIISTLTPQQRAFADAMQAYLSDTMAAKGNEVSIKKYGIRLFKKKDYFPIRVADQFMAKAREQQAGDRKLKDSGFTKERKPEAKNPVVLSAFTEIWAEHVDEMSLYHSFVLPLDDFNRVLNYHDAFVEGQEAVSVVEAITNAFGKGATNYIDQLIKDVNGGARGGSTVSFANSLVSKAKKAQTMASLSVAIQQPSSIIRAMSTVDAKYFLGAKVTEKTTERTWEEIKRYAPIAIIKEMGGYDTNVGKSTVDYLTDTADYETFGEKFKAIFTDSNYRDEQLGRLPAFMDEVTWGAIWNAVKREQRDLHPNMDVNSKVFMKSVADRFTEVITRTQVYDSVFSRSGLMRDKKSDLAKMMTSFMAEPTTTANMLAVTLFQAKRGDIKGKQVAKTVGSIVASLALNAALVSVVYAMRDDDEDKRYDEKYIENFWSNFFESLNPLTYIPYVRDIYNLFIKGYDVERADMELFGDLQNALDGLDNDDISAWEKTEAVIGSIGNLLGVPVKNILRDTKGLVQTFGFAFDDRKNPRTKTGAYMARRGMDLTDGEEMILAIQRGDEEHIQRVFGRYETQQEAESALQSAIGTQYKEGKLTAEEAQTMLTDNFDREDEYEVYWLLDKWDYAKEHGSSDGYTKMGALLDTIENGGDYVTEWQRYLDHGSEMSDIRSAITSKYKKQYLAADKTDREDIQDKLLQVYMDTGMSESDVLKKFSEWDFEAEYGMSYSDIKAEYREGNITESDLREAMNFNGLLTYEIDREVRELNEDIAFRKKFDMSLSEMKDAFDAGDVSRNVLIKALEYTGKTKAEAQQEVKKREISNRLGIDYMELDDAYKAGDLSRQTLYNAMIEAGSTKQEADDAILGYDWLKKNYKKYPDLTISDAKKFAVRLSSDYPEYTLTDFGVKIDDYIQYSKLRPECKGIDADGDGKADSGTKRTAIFEMIDSLPISSEAKDGLALMDYGIKSIKRYAPWH